MVCVHFRQILRSATGERWKMFAWKVELYTRLHGFKYEFSKIFWGRAPQALFPDPSPTKFRASLSIRASTSNLGCFVPSVCASPSIHSQYVWSFPQTREITNKNISPLHLNFLATPLCFITPFYRLSYVAGRLEQPAPPQYFRQVGAYVCNYVSFHLVTFHLSGELLINLLVTVCM